LLDPELTPREARRIRAEFIVITLALIVTAAAMLLGTVLHARCPAGEPIYGCRAVDGDTLRCGQERVRLLGIDAPEMPGHCRRGRRCVQGDPFISKARLEASLDRQMSIVRVGQDRYGRTLATVVGRHGDLSCLSIGVQKGPPIGVQKGPPSSSSVTGMTGALFALVAA